MGGQGAKPLVLVSHQLRGRGGGEIVLARWQMTNSRETHLLSHSEVLVLTTSSAFLPLL